jgi:uncharacterized peroxidase-related enzyme
MQRRCFLSAAIALCVLGAHTIARAETRVPLAPASAIAESVAPFSFEAAGSGRVPNYLRALPSGAAAPFARLVQAVVTGGTLPPSIKLAMLERTAQANGVDYAASYWKRLAAAAPATTDTDRQRLAIRYADALTRDAHGITDAFFTELRPRFNDAQLVELTLVTCFGNYFARVSAGLGLSAESWRTESPAAVAPAANPFSAARVTLLTDGEIATVIRLSGTDKKGGLGIGIANSQRAMARVPDIGDAWFGYWQEIRKQESLPRTTLLQVSLAVSNINGCRYCIVHQVVGLRRQGVEVSKLLALQKSDDSLSAEERAAVTFARKLTRTPGAVGDADFATLQAALPGTKAVDVVLQTSAFAFMNRFTDTLHLPSEDEAIHIYQEVFGTRPAGTE